jgi:hypothetical protein
LCHMCELGLSYALKIKTPQRAPEELLNGNLPHS